MLRTIPLYAVVVACAVIATVSAFSRAWADVAQQAKRSPTVLIPDNLQWREQASGVKVALLYGDPAKPGPFVLRAQYPAGFRKEPHHHPYDAYVTVLSGSNFRGYGNLFDKSQGVRLPAGSFSVNPKGVVHFEWTDEPAVIELHATGPWDSVYVDEFGQPLKK